MSCSSLNDTRPSSGLGYPRATVYFMTTFSRSYVFQIVLLFTFALTSGRTALAQTDATEALRVRVEALQLEPRIDGTPVADALFLVRFYESRSFRSAWDADTKLDGLLMALDRSLEHGLDPADYHGDLIRAYRERRRREPSADTSIDLDIIATDALARYAFHLRFGKVNPEAIEPTWNFSRTLEGVNAVNVVQGLIDSPDIGAALHALAPQGARYIELMRALSGYRAFAEDGGWLQVPSGEALRIGMRSPRVPLLRQRLHAEGFPFVDAGGELRDSELFDAELDAAVRT
ncbi:MAG TPA: hypothetical protein VLD39_05775, partial [Gammaproteobacteria bacterium]|nr:hypothetical protein [Gammaproteobacteria bacterium]